MRLLLPGNKITSCTHTRRQTVHRDDVTLSQYSSGQNLKDTWMFYYFTLMCKSLQISGWNHVVKGFGDTNLLVPPGIQLDKKKVRSVKAKTKPQYQSDKKQTNR